jgi:two-component system, NtrC family, C4-dicarboxylate transport sensor histidine kinase DctB
VVISSPDIVLTARRGLIAALALAVLAAATFLSYFVAERIALQSLREDAGHRINIYTSNLQAQLHRFEMLPQIVAVSDDVLALLTGPQDSQRQERTSRFLFSVNEQAGAAAVYVMDRHGVTQAASNWQQSDSFVGGNFAYRPYFTEAVEHRQGRFYGIGTVSGEPGYYFSSAVARDGQVLGVTAVKINLEPLDDAWNRDGEHVLVADRNGVIFLSSQPAWKFRTLAQLSSETMELLEQTRQYWHAASLSPWDWQTGHTLQEGTVIGRFDDPGSRGIDGGPLLRQSVAVPGTDWQLLLLTDIAPAYRAARIAALVAGLSVLLAGMLLLHISQRRRLVHQALAAGAALERANDELENRVQQRTDALTDANQQLHREIAERRRAEDTLRSTLADLVHTARMVALGRLSAGITHELNQPLAAMRTLSANAVVFMQRGRHDEVEVNLQMMIRVTEHMGRIASQLRCFARKSDSALAAVRAGQAAADAMFLFGQSSARHIIRLEQRDEGGDPVALCDASRLQQVLLNLLSNAADAVAESRAPHIVLRSDGDLSWVNFEVHDNGPGVSATVRAHLFEPFFTTKAQGKGLGLGLAVSASIVKEFGGSLIVGDSPLLGGALFAVRLRAAPPELFTNG